MSDVLSLPVQLISSTDSPTQAAGDALVIPVWEGGGPTSLEAGVDAATEGLLSKLRESKELTGKLYEATTLHVPGQLGSRILLTIGCGHREKWDTGRAFRCAATAAKALAGRARLKINWAWGEVLSGEAVGQAVAGSLVGGIGQDLYRADKKMFPAEQGTWFGVSEASFKQGRILAEAIQLTRKLVNLPADEIYPETFANQARDVAGMLGLECEIWDQARLEKEKCGSLLAVAKGSAREARLVILRYNGGAAGAPKLCLVGKGVTFDSGGLSLKTPDGMLTMKCDMAGAATVLGAITAIARMQLPINVIMLAGLVENMTGGRAMKLGDVLKARSGKTIEVHNTDAEGRLVLADVLDVAREQGASKIVDLATLTGACCVALGLDVAGMMSNDEIWQQAVLNAGKAAGEPLWPLPMFPEYNEEIAGNVADIKNVGNGRWGGAITAAKFLENFVGDTPWTHIDIAGPAFGDKPKPWLDAGASGIYVRTLVELAKSWK